MTKETSDKNFIANGRYVPCTFCTNKDGYCQVICISYKAYEEARIKRKQIIYENRSKYLTLNRYEKASAIKKRF